MRDYRIGRLKGKFVVTWIDETRTRRRYRLDADTLSAAQREAIDLIRRKTAPATGLTVADVWRGYCEDHAGRPATVTMGYTWKAIGPHFGHLRPDQITLGHSRSYSAARAKEGRAPGTVWTELGHLRTALNWAHKTGQIDRSPHIERPQKPAPKDRYLTRTEARRLIDAAREPHIRLAILLMLSTAGRVGAILDLTWTRVDLDRNQINLRTDSIGPRKGRAVVPINKGLRAALTVAREAAMSEFVVEWAGGRVRSIRRGFMSAAEGAGLEGVSPHTLRHTSAVHMAEAGVPMDQISQYLGHSNVQITASVYARFSPDFLADAADVLDFTKGNSVR